MRSHLIRWLLPATVMLHACGNAEPGGEPPAASALPAPLLPKTFDECIANPTDFLTVEGSMVFCGQFDTGTAKAILDEVGRLELRAIYLSSPGGFREEAMALASGLDAGGIAVHVFGECISACAHFLLAGLDDVTIEPATLIGFHHTANGHLAVLETSSVSAPPEVFAIVREQAEKENDFYLANRLDPHFLTTPMHDLNPICIDHVSTERIGMQTRWIMWTPSREIINAMRPTPVKGWWPADRYEHLRTVVQRYPDLELPQSFRFQHEAKIFGEPAMPTIGWCDER